MRRGNDWPHDSTLKLQAGLGAGAHATVASHSFMQPTKLQRIQVVDSHTCGEPTRVVVAGVSEPKGNSMAEKRLNFSEELDWMRSAVVCEPRGHDAVVGAMLCEPGEEDCVAGVIFFNNVGVLNGCLHGTMGLAVTLKHLGRIGDGQHRIDTPAGVVTVEVGEAGSVTVDNVRSFRYQSGIEVDVPGWETVKGDIAWGGNWFFLADSPVELIATVAGIDELTRFSMAVRRQLEASGITGEDGAVIDHIELSGPPADGGADGKNFVLCPGGAFDRSPCGTGTSAKLACLHASGKLKEGEQWRQAGILDTVFVGEVRKAGEGGVYPTVTGSAFVTAEAELMIDPRAPFAFGIPFG